MYTSRPYIFYLAKMLFFRESIFMENHVTIYAIRYGPLQNGRWLVLKQSQAPNANTDNKIGYTSAQKNYKLPQTVIRRKKIRGKAKNGKTNRQYKTLNSQTSPSHAVCVWRRKKTTRHKGRKIISDENTALKVFKVLLSVSFLFEIYFDQTQQALSFFSFVLSVCLYFLAHFFFFFFVSFAVIEAIISSARLCRLFYVLDCSMGWSVMLLLFFST